MAGEDRSANQPRRWLAPSAATALAATIFLIDTFSPLDMAIAVLYVIVVLLAANHVERIRLVAAGGACVALTLLSFAITHTEDYSVASVMRAVVSITAIGVATVLSLRSQAATRSLQEQADLLNLTHDAILVRDNADTITYWNQGAARLYGWSRGEALGRRGSELLQGARPGFPADLRAELLRSGRWEGELKQMRRDGSQAMVMSRWSLQRDEQGQPIATMETNSDITVQKHAEGALHRAQAELAHVTRVTTLGELAASIAHEVNQPLAAIAIGGEASLRWLSHPVPAIDEARASIRQMVADSRRASEVVARLRSLARRGDTRREAIDINNVVDETLLLVERELANHAVTLEHSPAVTLPAVLGDRVQLQQVLINLVLNAAQALDTMPASDRRLGISTAKAVTETGTAVVVTVRDNGPGIAPDNLPLIFKAFFSTKESGMGMGLSISRSIVESHGGFIDATLNEDGGMLFTIRLPVPEDVRS